MFSPGKERLDRTGVGGTSVKKLVLALSLCVLAGVVATPAHSAAPLAAAGGPIRTLALGGSGNQAFNTAYSSGDVTGTITRNSDVAGFNAMTPAQLRASYDVILVPWSVSSAFNLDWNTRLLPFLRQGGGVIYEDPNNLADLAPAVIGTSSSGGGWVVSAVPGLTDGINGTFDNDHFHLTSWDAAIFSPFITTNGGTRTVGLYGQIPGGGRIVITGPDQDFHASFGNNQYNLIVNSLNWVTSAPTFFDLRAMIPPLVAPGKLTQRYADILLQLINRAEAYVQAGAYSQAVSMLRSFQSYVARYENSGWLTGPEETALLDESNGIIAQLLP